MNTTITTFRKNTYENIEDNYELLDNDEDMKSNIEMPPQRDIRDTQPTISVNYRIVKNIDDKNLKEEQNYSNSFDNRDGWDNYDNEW